MQQLVDEIIEHLSVSQQEIARILEAKRLIAVRMAQIVNALPDHNPEFGGFPGLLEGASSLSKNVVSYLNSLAELQEAVAEHLTVVMKELDDPDEE